MTGNEEMLYQYMEGASKRFNIPVYQRNYDWNIQHCKRLFDDLVKVSKKDKNTHFFGSIVSAKDENKGMQEYLIIDGQQRLTTVSLILLALHDLIEQGKIKTSRNRLSEQIKNEFLIDKYEEESTRIKLKPVKNDMKAFRALIDDTGDKVRASNITINYNYFYNRILKQEISAEELFDAFKRLQIINIFLSSDDNPQLIFESLNSTGLDLSEGDKIRNYILMGVRPNKLQEKYYEIYWHQIEKYTNYNVSDFVRDYLSIKMLSTPTKKNVYLRFKEFMEKTPFKDSKHENGISSKELLMEDLLSYAKRYEILVEANSDNDELNSIIYRLNRFGSTVTRPFFMEVLKYSESLNNEVPLLSELELVEVFEIIENYIFRRQICDIPTNALNKIFVSLNNEIIRYDGTTENYVEKLKYNLSKRTTSGIFPNDSMFEEGLSNKQVYLMRSKNKKYIMERLENWGTKEVKDVWFLIDNGTYSIEHIMPQTLNSEWKDELGPDYEVIHEDWVDKLANLTLTAYNSKYSNRPFRQKLEMKNGFLDSGIRMNQHISKNKKWTLNELEERNQRIINRSLKIWPEVDSDYMPPKKEMEYITLLDDTSMTGRKIGKYSLLGDEQVVTSWVDAYIKIISVLHSQDPRILLELVTDVSEHSLERYFSDKEYDNLSNYKLEDGIYLHTNTNTDTKLNVLRELFQIYDIQEEELVFYLLEEHKDDLNNIKNPRHKKRKEFWIKALPVLKEKTNKFRNVNPSTANWQSTFIGHSGINVSVIANLNSIRIELYIGKRNKAVNDDIFNFIKSRKESIERESNQLFTWSNSPENITSKISLDYDGLGISRAKDWQTCIDLFADGVNIMHKYIVPIVNEYFLENDL